MLDIIEFAKEPVFWIVSILGSLFWSIIANLLTPYFATISSKISEKRKSKVEKKRQILLKEVQHVSSDQNQILNLKIDAIYWLLRIICILVFACIIFISFGYISNGIFRIAFIAITNIIILVRANQWLDKALNKYNIARLASERAEVITNFNADFFHTDYVLDTDTPDPYQDDLTYTLKKWDEKNII